MKKIILEALKHLKQYGPCDLDSGICYNSEVLIKDAGQIFDQYYFEKIVFPIFRSWPEFSGEIRYPVPGGMDEYDYAEFLWTGDYGAARYRLLDYMIEQLSRE